MPLNQTDGSQVQGLPVQGVEINRGHVSFHVDFLDPATHRYFDPTTYSVTITKNNVPYSESNLKVLTPLSREDESVGVWIYEFLTKDMVAGDYVFTITGSATGVSTVTYTVSFKSAEIPVEQYFVGALRLRLGDKRTKRYLVDDNTRFRWTNGELFSVLDDARIEIGQTPPGPTIFEWPFLYSEAHDLVLMGGFIKALMSRGIFEVFNKLNYQDELSMQLDRSILFANGQNLLNTYDQAKMRWKRDYMFHTARFVGLKSGRFPLYFSRLISLTQISEQTFFG
jgi:hypothetical protein